MRWGLEHHPSSLEQLHLVYSLALEIRLPFLGGWGRMGEEEAIASNTCLTYKECL